MKKPVLCLLTLAPPLLAEMSAAQADTIEFRTGERLTGHVIEEQPASVIFDSTALGRIEVGRERILRLERDPMPTPAAALAAGISARAEVAETNFVSSRDFLRFFYAAHGIQYEYVQPVQIPDPFRTNRIAENIAVRGRIGLKASFDGAAYHSGQGQQNVDSGAEARTLRFYTTGEFGLFRTNQFKLDLGLAGGEFYLHDADLRWPHLPYFGNLTFGYFTVPQTIENISPFGGGTFMEAGSPGLAFSPGHRVGVQLDRTYLEERMTASVGVFSVGQKASLDFGDASEALARPTLRMTGLLIDQPEQNRLLHLGGSAAFVFSDSADIRYQARPESHLAPVLVDTGSLPASFAYVGGLEAIYQEGHFTLQSEIMASTVDATEKYIFWGGYVSASWLVAGERPYNRSTGVPGNVRPDSPFRLGRGGWGAWEVALRYSYLDLQDRAVNGGRMNIFMPGLNWYWTESIRWQFNYGFAHVVEGPSPGNLGLFQMRLQFNL